jgi:alpha-ketoglutarate-dependent taurine dioxygenase
MVAQRHEILRTTFSHSSGRPVQIVAPLAVTPLPLCDLRQLSGEIQEQIVQHLAVAEAQRPFDLTRLPLMRMLVLQLADDRHILLLTVHHIIWDGWSTGIYLREIAAFYAAYVMQQPVSLPHLPIQYRDFSIWQQQWLQQEAFEEQISYWLQQLAGLTPLPFPTDRPRPEEPDYAGATQHFTIPAALAMGLKQLSIDENVTLFILLMAAFQVLLHRYTGVDDIAIGSNVANRTRAEVEDLIGFFVNTLVIRTNAGGNPRFRDFLRRVRDRAVEAYTHQDIPFEKIVERLSPRRNRGISPLVQIVFLMQNVPLPAWELQGNVLELLPIDAGIAKYDLVFSLEESGDVLYGQITYSTDLFTADSITLLAERYVTLLQSIVERPDTRIDLLEIFTAHERGHHPMKQHEQQQSIQKELRFARRKALNLYDLDLVTSNSLQEGKGPLVLQPKVGNVLIIDWARHNRAFLEQELLKHGAILFRGFSLDTTAKFEDFAHAISEESFKEYGDLPREQTSTHIYTSTPYPADLPILFHNESSHQKSWPAKICFFCAIAAQKGGATPIADCREIYSLLDPAIVKRFEQKKVMYVRNFIDELDVSWQQFFHTTERSVVEAYCARIHVSCEWTEKGYLRTKQVCPAVIQHPKTGAKVFFNQIQLFHPSLLETEARKAVLSLFQEDELPRNVYYGDGSRIEDSIIQEILSVYEQVAMRFTWHEGDVLLLDNMLMAHARDPYQGSRKILVSMAETTTL